MEYFFPPQYAYCARARDLYYCIRRISRQLRQPKQPHAAQAAQAAQVAQVAAEPGQPAQRMNMQHSLPIRGLLETVVATLDAAVETVLETVAKTIETVIIRYEVIKHNSPSMI